MVNPLHPSSCFSASLTFVIFHRGWLVVCSFYRVVSVTGRELSDNIYLDWIIEWKESNFDTCLCSILLYFSMITVSLLKCLHTYGEDRSLLYFLNVIELI